MSKIIRNVKKKFSRMERGQVLVVVALAAVGIIAIVGLVMDVGLMFIGNARLRRAVDSAALAAALQYRLNYTIPTLTKSANEFLVLNGMVNPNSTVTTCDHNPDPGMGCIPSQPRKLVRVYATADVKLAFLPVIGINSVSISATAVSEAASLDVVLVIDRSESMTVGTDLTTPLPMTDPKRDPFYCNAIPSASGNVSSCEPFNTVINAAIKFTQIMLFPDDQVSVVTFDKEPGLDPSTCLPSESILGRCPNLSLANGNSSAAVINELKQLTVFQGEETAADPDGSQSLFINGTATASPARCYGAWPTSCVPLKVCMGPPSWTLTSNYLGLVGPGQDPCLPGYVIPPDPSHYTTTNTGGGLKMAGYELATDKRQTVLGVVILLTDGVANAGHNDKGDIYFCPPATWTLLPRCNHGDASIRNKAFLDPPTDSIPNPAYDASDYAYDMADFVGLPYNLTTGSGGQNALIYTIGLGPEVNNYAQPGCNVDNPPPGCYIDPNNTDFTDFRHSTGEGLGRIFLNYAANVVKGHGGAYYAARPSDLNLIFRQIGSEIMTRLSQ